jgi:hypothetical protein
MSYWDPSLGRIARLETKVQGKKFGKNRTLFLFIPMRNSNVCIDADEKMPRVSPLTQATGAEDQSRLEKAKLAGLQDQLDRLRGRPWRPAMAKGEPPKNVDKSALIQTENCPVLHASLSAALERHVPGA